MIGKEASRLFRGHVTAREKRDVPLRAVQRGVFHD